MSESTLHKHSKIKRITISSSDNREFSIWLMILWVILFAIIGGLIIGALGAIIGIIAGVALSWRTVTHYQAKVKYKGGDRVIVQGQQMYINALTAMGKTS